MRDTFHFMWKFLFILAVFIFLNVTLLTVEYCILEMIGDI